MTNQTKVTGVNVKIAVLMYSPSEPKFRNKNVDIDDVTMRQDSANHIVHLQFQGSVEGAHNGFNLTNHTWKNSSIG